MALDTTKAWYTERDKIAIVGISDTNSQSFTDPAAGSIITLHVTKYDEDFIASDTGTGIGMSESPNIPSEFHDALAYYVIARGYEMKPELIQSAVYFKGLWREEITEAKKHKNKHGDNSSYNIIGEDY